MKERHKEVASASAEVALSDTKATEQNLIAIGKCLKRVAGAIETGEYIVNIIYKSSSGK